MSIYCPKAPGAAGSVSGLSCAWVTGCSGAGRGFETAASSGVECTVGRKECSLVAEDRSGHIAVRGSVLLQAVALCVVVDETVVGDEPKVVVPP